MDNLKNLPKSLYFILSFAAILILLAGGVTGYYLTIGKKDNAQVVSDIKNESQTPEQGQMEYFITDILPLHPDLQQKIGSQKVVGAIPFSGSSYSISYATGSGSTEWVVDVGEKLHEDITLFQGDNNVKKEFIESTRYLVKAEDYAELKKSLECGDVKSVIPARHSIITGTERVFGWDGDDPGTSKQQTRDLQDRLLIIEKECSGYGFGGEGVSLYKYPTGEKIVLERTRQKSFGNSLSVGVDGTIFGAIGHLIGLETLLIQPKDNGFIPGLLIYSTQTGKILQTIDLTKYN